MAGSDTNMASTNMALPPGFNCRHFRPSHVVDATSMPLLAFTSSAKTFRLFHRSSLTGCQHLKSLPNYRLLYCSSLTFYTWPISCSFLPFISLFLLVPVVPGSWSISSAGD